MYLISYDISKDKLRKKIAKTLENFGKRVQYSVFECILDEAKYRELHEKLVLLMAGTKEGSIRIYNLCASCQAKTLVIGVATAESGAKDLYII